jgi:anti-sigma B factor antagonist
VDLVDATGLGVLVGAHRRAVMRGRRVVLRNVSARVSRILRATRLNRILSVEPVTAK